jgi:hypothetical protein
MENSINEQKAILIGRISKIDYRVTKILRWWRSWPPIVFGLLIIFLSVSTLLEALQMAKELLDPEYSKSGGGGSIMIISLIITIFIILLLKQRLESGIRSPEELYYRQGRFYQLDYYGAISEIKIERYRWEGRNGLSINGSYKLILNYHVCKLDLQDWIELSGGKIELIN